MQIAQNLMKSLKCEWGQFKIGELFSVKRGKRLIKNDRKRGSIPYYSASNANNGLTDSISNPLFIEQDKIIVSTFGDAYFVAGKFTASDEITILGHTDLNKYNALFIVSVIKKCTLKFQFDCKAFSGKLKQETIFLPINSKKEPDFALMQNFIQNLTQEHTQKLISYYRFLQTNGGGGVSFEFSGYENFVKTYYHERSNPQNNEQTACHEVVPTSRNDQLENIEWKEFKLTDLFDYERGARLTKAHRIAGDIPLLTAGEFNQGVKEFISNEEQKIFSNAITIDMFCNSFVHMREFCCDDNILVLNAKENLSKEILLFIASVINKDKNKFGYNKQYRQNSLEKHFIFLPSIAPQNPHFSLMEAFIRSLKKEVLKNIILYRKYEQDSR